MGLVLHKYFHRAASRLQCRVRRKSQLDDVIVQKIYIDKIPDARDFTEEEKNQISRLSRRAFFSLREVSHIVKPIWELLEV